MSPHSLIPYVEGSPVDLTPWAYAYRRGDPANLPETDWLWPRKFDPHLTFFTLADPPATTDAGKTIYHFVSDVENGKMSARVEIPGRKAPKAVPLRLRHPEAARSRALRSMAGCGNSSIKIKS
jgi:hypothetical protein